MTLQDLNHRLSNGLGQKLVSAIVTVAVTSTLGGVGWLVSTTNKNTEQISALTEDVHNLVSLDRDYKSSTDSSISRIVNVQDEEDREISALQQAMRDRAAAEAAHQNGRAD